jgi:hypothetical protein
MSALGMGGGLPQALLGGAAPGGQADAPGPEEGDEEHFLQAALDALHKAQQADQDHIESAKIIKAIGIIQDLLAARQSGHESALGVTPAHKAMSRAYGG